MTKILIVDDDRIVQRLYAKQLQKSNYEISFAADGVEGLKVAHEIKPDVIILDYQMPRMSGDLMLYHLRRTTWGKYIRVIMITAANSLQNVPGMEEADLALYKPIATDELTTMIERLLQARV